MDYLNCFAISAAGMGVERARVEVASLNLANAHTVHAPGEAGFQPQRVVSSLPAAFAEQVDAGLAQQAAPEVVVEPTGAAARLVHDPGHPLADGRGFVAYPAVDPATEMVTLMTATRAYEANVAALNSARALALKTLEIGRTP